jgi:hypothetical protein
VPINLSIPLTTLQVGVREFGPATMANADSKIVMTIDRTVANGLTATPAARIDLNVMVSHDAGANWVSVAQTSYSGGSHLDRLGAVRTQDVLQIGFGPEVNRRLKAVLTVSGSSVAVAGTLATF